MPVAAQDLTLAATRTQTDLVYSVENGCLETLTAIVVSGNPRRGDTFVQLGLMNGGTSETNKSADLASGYVGAGFSIGWTGCIHLEPDDRIYISGWSNVVTIIRFVARVYRPRE